MKTVHFKKQRSLILTFMNATSLETVRSLLDARALPAFPTLSVCSFHWWLGAFRMTLHIAVTAFAQFTSRVANHTNFKFRIRDATADVKTLLVKFTQ